MFSKKKKRDNLLFLEVAFSNKYFALAEVRVPGVYTCLYKIKL